jgi:hypothetical protein
MLANDSGPEVKRTAERAGGGIVERDQVPARRKQQIVDRELSGAG